MIRLSILTFLSTCILLSCNTKTQETQVVNLEASPIRGELTKEQLEKVKFIQETFNEVYPVTLEETIQNFKRDQNPDIEIGIWMDMAESFEPYAQKNSGESMLENRKEAFKLILMRSMMPESEAINASQLKLLNDQEIKEIMSTYSQNAKPVTVEDK